MKTRLLFFITAFFLFLTGFQNIKAQETLDAKTKTQLREEIQYLGRNLPEFKAFMDSVNAMDAIIERLEGNLRRQEPVMIDKESKVSNLRVRVNELEAELERLRNIKPGRSRNIYFKLQIAAFENQTALAKYLESQAKFIRYEMDNGVRKYTFGQFNHYWEAKQIEKLLLGMGAQVFVVPYEDGKRIDIKSVPEEYL